MIPARARRRGRLGVLALLTTSGAAGLAGCYDFTYVEPVVAQPDAQSREAGEAAEAGSACAVGVESCGGDAVRGDPDTVYRCLADGGGALVRKCASGCVHDAGTGVAGRCIMPVAPCQVGGFYCGGDKLDGDPGVLYTCATGGTAVEKERCAKGCQIAKSGQDDACVK